MTAFALWLARMLELMFQDRGVGLAAPQVGLNIRLFVASPMFNPEEDVCGD